MWITAGQAQGPLDLLVQCITITLWMDNLLISGAMTT